MLRLMFLLILENTMELDPEERRKLDEIRRFARSEIREEAEMIDLDSRYPEELIKKLVDIGLFAFYIPKGYGGFGFSLFSLMESIRIISRECGSTALIPDVTVSLFGEPIIRYGSDFLKKRYLHRIARGSIGALAITEPGAGSDAAGIKTQARRTDGGYILNGTKTFITNGLQAEFFIVSAITDSSRKHSGMTLFVVDRDSDGLSIGREFKKMGIRGTSTTEVILENVEVRDSQVLGQVNSGFKIEMETLDVGRIGIAAQAIGISEGALMDVLKYVRSTGSTLNEGYRFILADMVNQLHSSVTKFYQAVDQVMKMTESTLSSSLSKLQAGDTAVSITERAIEILGYNAFTAEYPVERRFREAKITQIYEGTNEIQRVIISREVLRNGLPEF
ncbi:MAG: acyl-CoA dehydrogenase family protein [Thermoplasmatales archaeon]